MKKNLVWAITGVVLACMVDLSEATTIYSSGLITAVEQGYTDSYNLIGKDFITSFSYDPLFYNENRSYAEAFNDDMGHVQLEILTPFLWQPGHIEEFQLDGGKLMGYEVNEQVYDGWLSVSLDGFGYGDFRMVFDTAYDSGLAVYTGTITPTPTPEPATMFLFGTGIACLAGTRLRRRKK